MITKEQAEYIFRSIAYKEKTYKDLESEINLNKATISKQMKTFKQYFGLQEKEKYCAKTYLRYKYGKDIKEKYLSGVSTMKIAKEYGFSYDHMIAELLRDLGVEVRGVGYISKTNQNLFKNITNEIEAYVLGLILADGNIGRDYSISITLTASDSYLLDKINDELFNSTASTLTMVKSQGNSTYRILICGKQICDNLAKYGLVPNKSYLLKDFPRFEEPLMKHFIRGMYDGDGICAKNLNYLRIGYCGHNQELIQNFRDFLADKLQLRKNKLFNTGGCWDCSWGAKEDLIKIYHYLYDDATIFLSRKKNKLQNYLQGNTEVTS